MLTINLRLIRNDLHLMISRIEDIRQNYNKNITYAVMPSNYVSLFKNLDSFTNLDVDTKILIQEYVDLAYAFYNKNEPKMVNALLDQIAHAVRA